MWEDNACKAPIQKPVLTGHTNFEKPKDVYTAEWSDEYQMWVVYPIYYYPDGTRKDASGQIIL